MANPSWIEFDDFVYVAVQHSGHFCAVQHFFVAMYEFIPIHTLIPVGIPIRQFIIF